MQRVIVNKKNGTQFILRKDLRDTDIPLITSGWNNHIRSQNPFAELSVEEFRLHTESIKRLIKRSELSLAVSTEDDNQIYGFAVSQHNVLHMLYVRAPFRKYEIGKYLFSSLFPEFKKVSVDYTYPMKGAKYLKDKWNLRFNPYALVIK